MTAEAEAAKPDATSRSPRWPWAVLGLAAAWSVLIRIPLVINAGHHLDSDLAVDGLTLLDAVNGRWRWHYPGTPFMGSGAVLLSYPQALIWGAKPVTLVSGGTVAAVLLLVATFLMAWRAFGATVAAWSVVPLAFASTGSIWLSGRITGGHLLAATWHAGAFGLLAACLENGGRRRALALGIWCGLGLYLDSMFALTLVGILPAAFIAWLARGASKRAILTGGVFLIGFVAAVWPRPLGKWVDPYDAYGDQFAVSKEPEVLVAHGQILATLCLPRLLAGHTLPGFDTEPSPDALEGRPTRPTRGPLDPVAALAVAVTAVLAAGSALSLVLAIFAGNSLTARVVATGLVVSSAATLAGFVANRNIFNSDNYRYLVDLLVPWAVGFGLLARSICARGRRATVAAVVVALLYGAIMTCDLVRWYARLGWVDGRVWPVSRARDEPTLAWFKAHPEVNWITGGYWDVYKLSFLTGAGVLGKPFPVYPDRFPGLRPHPDSVDAVVVRPTAEGAYFREQALARGYRVVHSAKGVTILQRP